MNRGPSPASELLAAGTITVKGRLPWSTNATFLAEVTRGDDTGLAVYKPGRGERRLWDFPPRLYRREVAAYRLSEALGWGLVPPTAEREGPFGPGSLQQFVAADFEQHYFTLIEDDTHRDELRRICLFDLIANNADRKSGHCLLGEDGRVWAIDNGLAFHVEPKLRTVIWEFGGEPIPETLLDDVRRRLGPDLDAALAELLAAEEIAALHRRAETVVADGRFPSDPGGRSYPWPLV